MPNESIYIHINTINTRHGEHYLERYRPTHKSSICKSKYTQIESSIKRMGWHFAFAFRYCVHVIQVSSPRHPPRTTFHPDAASKHNIALIELNCLNATCNLVWQMNNKPGQIITRLLRATINRYMEHVCDGIPLKLHLPKRAHAILSAKRIVLRIFARIKRNLGV